MLIQFISHALAETGLLVIYFLAFLLRYVVCRVVKSLFLFCCWSCFLIKFIQKGICRCPSSLIGWKIDGIPLIYTNCVVTYCCCGAREEFSCIHIPLFHLLSNRHYYWLYIYHKVHYLKHTHDSHHTTDDAATSYDNVKYLLGPSVFHVYLFMLEVCQK